MSSRNKKKRRKRSMMVEPSQELNLVAMMDMFTILLVFLLKSYSASALAIPSGPGMQPPQSTNELEASDAIKLIVSGIDEDGNPGKITVDDEGSTVVVTLDEKTMASLKKEATRRSRRNFLIKDLEKALSVKSNQARELAKLSNGAITFEGNILVIADKSTPYWLITQVLYTSAQSGYDRYKLVAVKKNQ